ncbi:BrnA antitoxin family protein [Jiella avicenniae]|uniref:BrnA antitoxin family protein n=1 Tax=Jiella avicenniae TaxID=2907202 RepID=A0A9X1P0A0_9HYPH|nr:BrnA antitoxin family protein [Jiella avicenniae]MCE7027424.1 BrnA antitoxin family protein [Jiella avicenniae]
MTNSSDKVFDPEHAAANGYTKSDWDEVADNPEWTAEHFAAAKPFDAMFPKLDASIKRSRGRPKIEKPRQQISLRLDPDVIAKFKATGEGWQSRINEILKKAEL